jgi:predicted lysophospholipase L1 biosynthesis ABC-type transport system permease subunit
VQIDGVSTPTFGTTPERGDLLFLVLSGRAPRGDNEIAFAPQTMNDLGLHLGDTVSVEGLPSPVRVVGKALVTETSHTAYDQSAWMSGDALQRALDAQPPGSSDVEDYLLVKWKPGADVAAAMQRFRKLKPDDGFAGRATLPSAVIELGRLRVLPLSLAIFFAFLAIATVAHALVTTVRRRRHDLAVMRSFGFTARQSRVAIAWQATLLAAAGVVVGVPLGIIVGRAIWRGLANSYPVVYVPPLALAVVLLVIPLAILVVNAIAVGPGRAAARIRPAEALRVE